MRKRHKGRLEKVLQDFKGEAFGHGAKRLRWVVLQMIRFFKRIWLKYFGPKECHHIGFDL